MQLFAVGGEWSQAAQHVSVFEVTKRFILELPDKDVSSVVRWLHQRGIALSVQMTPLVATKACGLGVEGYGPPDDMARVAEKLKRLGGDLGYLRMDEPLWYGHVFNQRGLAVGCHLPIGEIAQETVRKLGQVRRMYPKVRIGDIEPLGAAVRGWVPELSEWMSAFRSQAGETLAFLHADIVWTEPDWQSQLRNIAHVLQHEEVALGIIYDGTLSDATDHDWTKDAIGHFTFVEGRMGIVPEQAIIQSWMNRPARMLPEGMDGSLTGLLADYLTWHGVRLNHPNAAEIGTTAASPTRR